MPFNITLILAIFAAVGASTLAATHVRAMAAELDAGARERIARALAKVELLWRALEWGGVLVLILSLFTHVFTKKFSDRYVIAACGAALMCAVNAAAAWHARSIYAREAPGSAAATSARRAAWGVTCAELSVIAVLGFLLSQHVDLGKMFRSHDTQNVARDADSPSDSDENKGLWLDESLALQELNWLKKDELEQLVQNSSVKSKTVAGKKLYNADDVERLKKQQKQNANLPD